MAWKDIKPWLKGGIIGGIIGVLIFIINYLLKGALMILVLPASILLILGDVNSKEYFLMGGLLAAIIMFISYFIIGSVLGLFMDKIKSKKKK